MIKYQCNPPALLKYIFSEFKWNSDSEKILLTFDDGPIPETTESILKILNNHGIKSVFFCVGNNVKNNPGLTDSILSEGHTIGNHTFNHLHVTKTSWQVLNDELDSFNNLLEDKHGCRVKYFRPPYGRFNLSLPVLLRQKNLINVMWSLLTYDYKSDLNVFKKTVSDYAEKNSIVVMHDSLKSKSILRESLEFLLESAAKRGFEIGEPSECLK